MARCCFSPSAFAWNRFPQTPDGAIGGAAIGLGATIGFYALQPYIGYSALFVLFFDSGWRSACSMAACCNGATASARSWFAACSRQADRPRLLRDFGIWFPFAPQGWTTRSTSSTGRLRTCRDSRRCSSARKAWSALLETETELSASMTPTQFDNGYWYATELSTLRRISGSRPRASCARRARKGDQSFLRTGRIENPAKRSLSTSA